ncbi:AIR synthase family protein [Natronosalvus halobius]|uniref:AIR synthase family protein n=1 Tax=Natronosalvus halobius TaxID=2953746 RepID=UPI00209DAFA8|nr:AIR synthase family protein [Natronosalvus halobius]USZ71655.1 AIR synthase family protein [Natronosalvus halobius]
MDREPLERAISRPKRPPRERPTVTDPSREPALGKIDRTVFERQIAPRLGADRDDVVLGPTHGVDFGVLDVGGRAVVVATDPVSILPDLGLERAARFALDIVLTDVAVSGISPSHLSISFTLPPEMTDEQFATVWEAIHEECVDLGIAITAGHTARYAGISYSWVGGATVLGVGDREDVVRPDGARPGDALLLTTGPAVEAVALLSTLFGDRIDVSEALLQDARDCLDDSFAVRDALAAAASAPVHAMHDVTEGGLAGALVEMSEGSGTRFEVDRSAVPIRPAVRAVCDALEMDPWRATSCGSLVIAVDPGDVSAVVDALESRGTTVAEIGHVQEAGVAPEARVDGAVLEHPGVDSSWGAFERLTGE